MEDTDAEITKQITVDDVLAMDIGKLFNEILKAVG